ncbi:unnamed protein product [Rotaria sp. Silwood1]|nr:unnamed protein product [Rotaria sp. Silwood1]
MIISEELHHFQWLDESSSIGVATITTSSVKIVILYNSQDKTSCEFFDEMEAFLKPEPDRRSPSPPPQRRNQTTQGIDDYL